MKKNNLYNKTLFILTLIITLFWSNNYLFSQNYIVFSTYNDKFWYMNADSAFVYHSISDSLDAIAPYSGSDKVPITVSHDGNWYAFRSTRFDNENGGWGDLVIVKSDYSEYEVIKLDGHLIHSTGRAMVFNNGKSIVFVSEDFGNHSKDVYVIHKNGNTWGDTVNLTRNSTYEYNNFPTISPDGTKVLFDAAPTSYPSVAVGEVNIDGTGLHFPIVAGSGEEAHSGSYDSDGAIIYEGSSNESIWRLPAGSSTPVKIASDQANDNTPFVLPDGRIVSLELPNVTHQIKIMNADGTDNHMLTNGNSSSFNEVYDLGLSGYSKSGNTSQAIIIDHNCTKLASIPESAINNAKQNLHIAYEHTSHGSQLMTGMTALVGQTNLNGYKGDIYRWNEGGTNGALDIDDNFANGGDLGHNGDTAWAQKTRTYLNNPAHSDVNIIIWSWCGGVQDNTQEGIQIYLDKMNELEQTYPNVTFVYMTGHSNIWHDATVKANNKQIRDYCIANNKVLYDFYDIERYNPDGTFFEFTNDNCDYYNSAGGTSQGNWATEWQNSHTEGTDWYNCDPAHTKPLNGNLKAYAAWWLWCRLAGWNGVTDNQNPSVPQNLQATVASSSQIDLTWDASTDNVGVNGYKIYRNGNFLTTTSTNSYSDNGLQAATEYTYTVSAFDAAGNESAQSSSVSATTDSNNDTEAPSVPQNLQATAVSTSQINLTWDASTDNVAVAGYKVFRNSNLIDTVTNSTEFNDTGLNAATEYTYTVSAFDAAGNESAQSSSVSATTGDSNDTEAPTVPQNLQATVVSASQIILTWNTSTDNVAVAGYKVFRNGNLVDTVINSTAFTDTGLDAATEYAYMLSAFDAAGNESAKSTEVKATTKPDNIEEIDESSLINIYPNPVSEEIYLEFENIKIQKIVITDFSGKILFEKNNIQNKESVNVSNFKSGIYFIKIISSEKNYIQKIIKK